MTELTLPVLRLLSRGPEHSACIDCGTDTIEAGEYYMLRDDVWLSIGLTRDGGMLCIGCVESRLGRSLNPSDFTNAGINTQSNAWRSARFNARLAAQETLLDDVLSELRKLGSPGARLVRWVTQEFNQGRVQAWAEAVGADDAMVCAQAVAAAKALESHRQRHLPLPDWRSFTWEELNEWTADEGDADELPVWEERNVVYRFEDGWTLERVTTREDLFQESRLMRNCAGTTMPLTEPLLSLRDPRGRPHLDVKFQRSGRVLEIGGKAQGPIKPAYAARLRRAFEGHRIYYAECDSWIPEPYKEDPLWGMDLFLDSRFLFEIFKRDPWEGPDEFGIFDPRTRQHAVERDKGVVRWQQ
jgi:hypothetical protein